MALKQDPIKGQLKKIAAELVVQGITGEELVKRLKQEKLKLETTQETTGVSKTKKDQLQVPSAAVDVNTALDMESSSESGSSVLLPEDYPTGLKEIFAELDKKEEQKLIRRDKKEDEVISFLEERNIDPYNIEYDNTTPATLGTFGYVPSYELESKEVISFDKKLEIVKDVESSIQNVLLNPSSVEGLIYESANYAKAYTSWDEDQQELIKSYVKDSVEQSIGFKINKDSFNNIYDNVYGNQVGIAQNKADTQRNIERNNYSLDDNFLLETTQGFLKEGGASVRQKVKLNAQIDEAYSRFQAEKDPLKKEKYREEVIRLQEQMSKVGERYNSEGILMRASDVEEQGQFFGLDGMKNLTEEEIKKLKEKALLYKEQGRKNAKTVAESQNITQREAAKQEYKNAVLDLQIFNKKSSEQTLTYDLNTVGDKSILFYFKQAGIDIPENGIIKLSIADLYKANTNAASFEGFFQIEGWATDGFSEQEITALKMYDEEKLELNARLAGLFDLAVVNTDPASIDTLPFLPNLVVSGTRAVGRSWFGLNDDDLDGFLGKTDRDRLNDLNAAIEVINKGIVKGDTKADIIELNDKQKEAVDVSMSELVSTGIGEFVPMIIELAALSYVTGGIGTITGVTKAFQALRSGNAWSKALYHTTNLLVEEVKMQGVFDFAPTTGAAFYGGGALTQNVFKFKGKYKWLDPVFQKVIKAGPVGAASAELGELTTFAYKDLMNDQDFSANFNKHFGDLDETKQRILVNALVFGVTGVHSVKKTDLMSTQKKIRLATELVQKNNDMLNGVTQGKKGIDGQLPEFSIGPKRKLEDLSKKEREQYDANEAAAANLSQLAIIEMNSVKLDVQSPAFERNYQEQVITPMNKALKQIIPGYKGVKVVFGKGEKFRLENFDNPFEDRAQYDPKTNTMFLDLQQFDLAIGNHEIFHASVNAYFTENPKASKNFTKKMSEVFAGQEIEGLPAEAIEKAIEMGYGEEGPNGEFKIKKDLLAEEFLAFAIETVSRPEFYYSNKDLAGTVLGQIKLDLKNFMGEYMGGFKPQTAKDVLQIFASLGESVRTGGKIEKKIQALAELDKINVLGYEVNNTLEKGGVEVGKFASKEIDLAKEKIESQMDALEEKLNDQTIDYDNYSQQMKALEVKLEAVEKGEVAKEVKIEKPKPKAEIKAKPVRTTDLGPRDPRSKKIMDTYNEGTRDKERTNYSANNPLPGGLESKLVPQFEGYINTIVDQKFRQTTDEAFNKEDALAVLRAEIPKALRTFNPNKNKDLAGYVKKLIQTRQSLMFKDVNKEFTTDIDTAKGITTGSKLTGSSDTRLEPTLIEPVERLVKDPNLKAEFIEKVNEATKNLDPKKVNYKNLTDASPELTAKIFGEVFKEVKGKTKLDKAKTLKLRQQFIRNNARILYKLLPEGARKMADKFSTSTGIQQSLLTKFYEVGDRADMIEGTAAGLPEQVKKPFNKDAFLEPFGALKDQPPSRNHETAITALMREIGKAMTNRVYRQKLEAADVSMKTIQQIADGKSANMAAKGGTAELAKYILNEKARSGIDKLSEKDLSKIIEDAVSKNPTTLDSSTKLLQILGSSIVGRDKWEGLNAVYLKNVANSTGRTVAEQVKFDNVIETAYKEVYEKEGLDYKTSKQLNEFPQTITNVNTSILKGLPEFSKLPPEAQKIARATVLIGGRWYPNNIPLTNKARGGKTPNDLIDILYGKKEIGKGENKQYYSTVYTPEWGKGSVSGKSPFGTGFNGKLEQKINELNKNKKLTTEQKSTMLVEYTRNELTHPSLRDTPGGYELTVDSNLSWMKDTYRGLAEAYYSKKITKQELYDFLRMQTNSSKSIFKSLVPVLSVTKGSADFKTGKGKNTHNEHMSALFSYNNKFLKLLKNSKNIEQFKDKLDSLVDGLGQAIIETSTQKVKDSPENLGRSGQVYNEPSLNTFLEKGSAKNQVIIYGKDKGKTVERVLFEQYGANNLLNKLENVPAKERTTNWEILNKLVTDVVKSRQHPNPKFAAKDLGKTLDKIIFETTGEKRSFSDVTAKIEAGNKGKYKLFVSASADDFVGLMNYNAGKGKVGEGHQEFFRKNLYEPYAKAYTLMNTQNVEMARQFRDIKKHIKSNSPDFNLTKKVPGSKFTYEQALRVAIWDKQGYEIPGLSKVEVTNLKKVIDSNVDLQVLALNLKRIAGGEYVKPGKDWYAGDIASDLRQGLNTTLRSKYLTDWKSNVDAMFTPENLNKLEAVHGTPYRKALENMLEAMYTGKTRRTSPSSLEGRSLNYLNNSVGTIMFLNQRSATLQMLSSFNYINWSDNNPLQAGKALTNVPQFAKDFKTLFNSDWAKSRREGLRINVTESEIAEAVNGSKNVPKSIVSFLLKKGFLPTQIADSMATALGGASFYRNRTNTYVKKGMTLEKAEAKAMQDWVEISETNQQSSRPDKISMQQRSDLGKLLLAFANTPMQYTRETKKALLDIKNGRGDLKTNLSKVAYYTFVQNAIFSGLQSAIFKMAWSDDEQDQIFLDKKAPKIINSMGDSFLRGMGIGGALVSTLKNAGIKLYERSDRGGRGRLKDVAFDLLDVSPPISSKVGKVYSALDAIDRAGGFEAATQAPVDLKNPLIKSGALMTEALGNIPADRALQKIQTITEAASSNREWYEKLALMSGWKSWEIDPEVVYKSREEKTAERKAKRQEVFKKMSYKDYQTYKLWKKQKVNKGKDIVDFVEAKKGK